MRLNPYAAFLVGLIALTVSARADSGPPQNLIATGDFDFYVLTLSWSPGFCDTGGAAKSKDQCSVGAGEGFVIHGLWPDNAYKADPADCGSPGDIPNDVLQQTRGRLPRAGPCALRIRASMEPARVSAPRTISRPSNTRATRLPSRISCSPRTTA